MSSSTPPFTWQIHHCQSADCGLRYPVAPAAEPDARPACNDGRIGSAPRCARCRGPVCVTYHTRENAPATQIGADARPASGTDAQPAVAVPLCGLIDNLRSAFNVGSVLRIADGAGFAHVHLCGISATPQQAKVRKTALGAEASVPWSYHPNAVQAADQLRIQGWYLVALETAPAAHSLFAAAQRLPPGAPLALMVGNEVTGLDPQLLDLAHTVLAIPMHGHKESLNVAVAFGIAAYWLRGTVSVSRATWP